MNSSKELHYRYIVSYLLVAIILLIALAYYDVPNLVDKFAFALTLCSLLLAILAIFYTKISAQKQDLQLTRLVETNASLVSAATEITSAAQDIRVFAREAPHHFQLLGGKIDTFTAKYETLKSPQLLQVEANPDETVLPINIDRAQFRWMFGRLQFDGMAVLYLFERSCSKGKSIEPETFENLTISSLDYAIGILNGLETSGVIEFKIHQSTIIPVKCSDFVSDEITDALASVQRAVGQKTAERLRTLMTRIEDHVG